MASLMISEICSDAGFVSFSNVFFIIIYEQGNDIGQLLFFSS